MAAKILTCEATQESGPVRERDILHAIGQRADCNLDEEGFDYLLVLRDDFTITIAGLGQSHLCIIQTLHSTSISALRRSAPSKSLPVYMVRSIIYMTLQALQSLHSLHIYCSHG